MNFVLQLTFTVEHRPELFTTIDRHPSSTTIPLNVQIRYAAVSLTADTVKIRTAAVSTAHIPLLSFPVIEQTS
jgi:hypothetical protein